MKVNSVEIAKRWVGTYNQALVGESGVMGTGASTVLMLIEELSQAEAQLASVKEDVRIGAKVCATLTDQVNDLQEQNASIKAENARLKAPVTHKEVGEIDKRRLEWSEDVSAGTAMKYALTEWVSAHAWCEIKERKANQRIAELEQQLAASRASAMEEAAAIVENGSAFSGYTQVASIHAKWIRDAINPPAPEAADAPPPRD
jgi:chromosome segregation ATPase